MSAYSDSLKAERDAVMALLRLWTDAFVAAGAPGDFAVNVEGESYDFSGWRLAKLAELEKLDAMIRAHQPFAIRSRQRG